MLRISTVLDILSYLVALLGAAPLYLYLDLPAQIALPAALLFGIGCDRRRHYPVGPLPATLASIGCLGAYALQASLANLVNPVVNTLVLLLAIRLATEKSGRNYLQIFVLAIFALAGSTLLTLGIGFFFYLVALVLLVTVGLVLLSFHSADPNLRLGRAEARKVFSVALLLPAASLVLMLFFFAILPRTRHPLWNFLNPTTVATTGFSDKVRPGAFAAIAATREVAFRVTSDPVDADQLYWRTIVLNTLQGNTWVRQEPPEMDSGGISGGRKSIQQIYCEPRQGRYLPVLDIPVSVQGPRSRSSSDRVFSTRRPIERRLSYQVVSSFGGKIEHRRAVDRQFYLRPPATVSERVQAVGLDLAAGEGTAFEKIARLKEFFFEQGLAYANSDLPSTADPVDEFLFAKKRGYCEFFASSFAQLLRLGGVPARLVGGYLGGEYNELGGYYLVTEDKAHVWVEALLDDNSWVRIDPSRLARNADAALIGPRSAGLGLGRRLADTVDYYWTQMVISYDFGRQFQILNKAHSKFTGRGNSLPGKKAVVYLLLLAAGVWLLVKGIKRSGSSREERILGAFLHRVEKRHGLEKLPANCGLHELCKRVKDPLAAEFVEIYAGAVYRDRPLNREEMGRLRKIVRRMPRR